MQTPAEPLDEKERLEALRALDILDTDPEEKFDRLTRIARAMLDAPIALVSLVDTDRQWFKSRQGLDASETPREISFCGHAILAADTFYIPSTLEDARFADNPLVTGPPDIRSYVGVPISNSRGFRIGTLCVIDTKTTSYSDEQLDLLRDIASSIENLLVHTDLVELSAQLKAQEKHLENALDSISQYNDVLERLHALTSANDGSTRDRIESILELGRATFGLSIGLVSQIEDDKYTVLYACSDDSTPQPGTVFDLQDTYCLHTMMANKALGFHNVAESEIADKSCYQKFMLESYIGVPLKVNGKLKGTLGFASAEPRQHPFSREQFSLLNIIAEWLGREIERDSTTRSLQRAKDEAVQHSRAKSEFLNSMSHELRTPLTIILGYLPMLKDPENPPEASLLAEIAGDMETAGQHLLTMIGDLLDISRIEAGKIALNLETLDLNELVGSVVSSFDTLAQQKGLTLEASVSGNDVYGDSTRIKQILFNLLSNSVKFTDSGTVRVSAGEIEGGTEFVVQDSGCGIPDDQQSHIFEKFHQVDSSSTRRYRGSGLGLAITRQLIKLHNGDIKLDSKPDVGSTFTFTIMANGKPAHA